MSARYGGAVPSFLTEYFLPVAFFFFLLALTWRARTFENPRECSAEMSKCIFPHASGGLTLTKAFLPHREAVETFLHNPELRIIQYVTLTSRPRY